MGRLQIQNARERRLVGAADGVLAVARLARRRGRPPSAEVARILLLRLERIGDLLMALPAIADVRASAPQARIDLVVGSWNAALAEAMPGVSRVETIDARWLARGGAGVDAIGLVRTARRWRERRYDLAINFEPDIRSNLALAASGAAWTAGYASGGGGPLLDQALDFDPRAHTAENARRLVAGVFGAGAVRSGDARLALPAGAVEAARPRLAAAAGRRLVGIHVSGGRAIKQWDPERFAEVARHAADALGAAIVLTGAGADRAMVDGLARSLAGRPVIDAAGDFDLLTVAALLARLDVFVTGDTGPMHLAHAVGTPVVAVFGPSDPVRYAPRGPRDRIVRIDLPCSPCNRIRQPPARCVGHTPDCLAGVPASAVIGALEAVLGVSGAPMPQRARA